jgi:hypothetical protein
VAAVAVYESNHLSSCFLSVAQQHLAQPTGNAIHETKHSQHSSSSVLFKRESVHPEYLMSFSCSYFLAQQTLEGSDNLLYTIIKPAAAVAARG